MKLEERRLQLERLYNKQGGRCHICNCETVLEGRPCGGKLNPRMAVRFRLGSSFGAKGRVRRRVMTCQKCAQERSDQIQDSQPIEELWRRSGREATEFWTASTPQSQSKDRTLTEQVSQNPTLSHETN